MSENEKNLDNRVIAGFGEEWSRFSQSDLSGADGAAMFDAYFSIFRWSAIPESAVGADIGSGSGRWAAFMAPKVGHLHLIEPSPAALEVSRQNLIGATNVSFHNAVVGDLPVADASLDFAYSLGVLHHVPDTLKEIKSIGIKLKPGAPFLVYLYYAFDNRPAWFKLLWRLSDVFRLAISRLPATLRYWTCDLIAAMVYWPLARIALFLDHFGVMPQSWPLAAYRSRSFYVLRTDALDRFGTRLEQRFTKAEITDMLTEAGFSNIEFSNSPPFWTAVASKR